MNGHHPGCAVGEEQICYLLEWCSAWLPASHPCQLEQWTCCHFSVIKSFLPIGICTIRGFYWIFLFSFRASHIHAATPETPGRQSSVGRSSLPRPQELQLCGAAVGDLFQTIRYMLG